jgi:protocatechuate 3,4-dioxygenase beta subunit
MDLPDRRRVLLGAVLVGVLALVLVGWWVMGQQAADTAEPSEGAASSEAVPAAPSSPAPKSPSPAVAAASVSPIASQASSTLGSFRGRVIDAAARGPVRAFEVRFDGGRPTGTAVEAPGTRKFDSEDGRFEWTALSPGNWIVSVVAPGFQRFELADLKIEAGLRTPEIVLPLRRGYEVRGRVYDEASGQGIAAASIGSRPAGTGRFEGNWRTRSRAASASDGSFALEGLPQGRMTLEVYVQGYAGREVDVVVEQETSPVDIALSTGGAITGRLTAADGVTPVAGYAGLWDLDDGFGGKHRTDDTGEFKFEHLSPGPYQISGEIAGRAPVTREFVITGNERMDGVVLALTEGRTIRGMIAGLRPDELKRVRIRMHRAGQEAGFSDAGVDADGAYEIRGVQAGRVSLLAEAPGRQVSRTIDVPADADVTANIEFSAGVRVSGRVTRGGRPLAGVAVTPRPALRGAVYNYGTSTSSDGAYSFDGLAPGEYTFRVEGHTTPALQVSRDTVFDIDIPQSQLSGRVLEDESQVPVVGANVQLWPADPGSSQRRRGAGSDHFGQFSLSGLEPGEYMLAAHLPGYEMYRKRISYTSSAAEMTIRLRRDAGVEIRVRAAAPLREVLVTEMIGDRSGSWMQVLLDDEGKGRLPGALAGSTLSFRAEGHIERIVRGWSGQSLDVALVRQKAQ